MYVDSHCHLSFPELHDALPEIRARHGRPRRSTARCASAPRWRNSTRCTRWRWRTTTSGARVGVHPDNEGVPSRRCDDLRATAPRCRAWWRSARPGWTTTGSNGRSVAEMDWQRERFRTHIRAARRPGCRWSSTRGSASDDTLALILREEGRGACAAASSTASPRPREVAAAALDLGFYISFSGILTFRNAEDLREVARAGAAGPLPDRDRQPLSGAGAVPRQDQPPGLRRRTSRPSWPSSKGCRSPRWHAPPAPISSGCSACRRRRRTTP